jgi:hypothetical protein
MEKFFELVESGGYIDVPFARDQSEYQPRSFMVEK